MEKIKTFTFLLALLTAVCATGQTLSFKFDAPRIIFVTPNNFLEFDVLVEADQVQNLYSGKVTFTFSGSLSNNTGDWSVTKGEVLDGVNGDSDQKYTISAGTIIGNEFTVTFIAAASSDPNVNSDYNAISTSAFQKLVTVRVLRNGPTAGTAGITFVEDEMDGEFNYVTSGADVNPFTNSYDSKNFADLYVGRIFASGVNVIPGFPGWSQNGATGTLTLDPFNTSIWSGDAQSAISVQFVAGDLRIHEGASYKLNIGTTNNGGQLIAETIEINGANALILESSASGTGAVIANAITGLGTAVVNRHMTGEKWHLISGTASQSVESFLAANGNIPTKDFLGTDRRGMMDYNTTVNGWSDFFLDTSQPGTMTTGKGFAARTSSDGNVTFTGSIVAGNINVPIVDDGQGWNLIGNPYTSAIDLNNNANNFLAQNTAQLDPSYVAVYVWEETETTSQYKISNLTDSNVPDTLAIAQGFFVKSKAGGGTIQFNRLMQFHSPFVKLKSGTQQAGLKLIATNNNGSSSTDVMFLQNGTPGLDPGFDAGALKLDRNFAMYTRLVEDNGVDFAIQSLPRNGFEKYVVPVGLDFKEGGQVAFTAQLLSLPSSINVVLEDRLNNIFTPLNSDDSRYTATVAANASSTGRFYLHVSYSTTGIEDELNTNPINAYMMRNEIIIDGKVSSNAIATLYDLQGRLVLSRNLEQGLRNRIMSQGLKTGVYLLQIVDNGQRVSFKLPVVE